tara:strand:- start:753 stop:980 length:228 start_codon:yes stop_codon:yes gene_type:complete
MGYKYNQFFYDYKTIYGTLPKSDEFNEEFKSMVKNGWEIDGQTTYVATPPTGKIVCIQRFKKRPKNVVDIDVTFG